MTSTPASPFAPIQIPPGASFADMVALKGRSDIGDQINKTIIRPLEEANHLVIKADFNDDALLGQGKEKVEKLGNLIAIFQSPDLDFSKNRADGDADTLIDSLEQLLSKQRQVKQGAMQELLTGQRRFPGCVGEWAEVAFGDVAQPRRDRVIPLNLVEAPLCVELEDIQAGEGCLAGQVTESRQAGLKTVFSRGDVLFGKLRAYQRKHWCAEFDGVCSTEIWALRPVGVLVSSALLHGLVQRDDFIEVASSAYGTHMPRSDWNVVKAFRLRLPPDPAEQHAIAQVLTDMDSALTTLQARLAKARDLKQALMQALLTGRIRLLPPAATAAGPV